jgi:PTS system ascorbate-specific IIA component
MTNALLIIAHAPLAQALRQCALHVFPDVAAEIAAVDVHPDAPPEKTLELVHEALRCLPDAGVLIITDILGATPCNVAMRSMDNQRMRLVAGANLPMLMRALTYRDRPIDEQVARAIAGGVQGVMQVPAAAA